MMDAYILMVDSETIAVFTDPMEAQTYADGKGIINYYLLRKDLISKIYQ